MLSYLVRRGAAPGRRSSGGRSPRRKAAADRTSDNRKNLSNNVYIRLLYSIVSTDSKQGGGLLVSEMLELSWVYRVYFGRVRGYAIQASSLIYGSHITNAPSCAARADGSDSIRSLATTSVGFLGDAGGVFTLNGWGEGRGGGGDRFELLNRSQGFSLHEIVAIVEFSKLS